MIRRLLSLAIALGLAILASIGSAQQPRTIPVVGILVPSIGPDHPLLDTLRNRLRELGYVDGQSIRYEFRGAQSHLDRLPGLAEELVRSKVDVILAATEPAVLAAKDATTTIPIVMVAYASDPAASGLIDSFGRPGGNVARIFTREPELLGKRLELLKEAIPGLSRVVVFWDSFSTSKERDWLKQAAPSLGIRLDFMELRVPYDLKAAVRTAKTNKAGAIMIMFSPALFIYTERRSQRKPSSIGWRYPVIWTNTRVPED